MTQLKLDKSKSIVLFSSQQHFKSVKKEKEILETKEVYGDLIMRRLYFGLYLLFYVYSICPLTL